MQFADFFFSFLTGLVDPTTYVRNRVKTASPYSASGGMWRASCEGLTKTQLHYHYPPKSAGDAFCTYFSRMWR